MNTTETLIRCTIATILAICALFIFILPIFYTNENEDVNESPISEINIKSDNLIGKDARILSDADISFINECKKKGFKGCTINGTYISFYPLSQAE